MLVTVSTIKNKRKERKRKKTRKIELCLIDGKDDSILTK